MKRTTHEPRAVVILRHIHGYLLRTGVSEETYAAQVGELYRARVPDPRQRTMRFHSGGDPCADSKANWQLVSRILNRTVKMPVDLEEALVLALPPEEQRAVWVELDARVGQLSIAMPQNGRDGQAADLGRLAIKFGEAVAHYGRLLEGDGVIDQQDGRAQLEEAREVSRQFVAAIGTFVEHINAAIDAQDGRRRLQAVSGPRGGHRHG